ncbi:tannase/feruloyl esterase family alpha/beta hydrolase [Falsiroseomonas bella]|uniref:Tannase/feruloyl esterase family alpha/beta hydrolase n=1 Tax=Falsiroseomonas bella TaxID=2184016 RepID=A0A317FK11_9PROT|nr:tannase/feruloyl esterase family alpha/beta hydrolase [Falsiroseomonas bella]PWS38953.1 tannase/feruloyl esterase family alpha/beta hydrolase [Falsiroseomonas bella]
MRTMLAGAALAFLLTQGAAAQTTDCAGLAGLRIAAADITLPTGGAEVTEAAAVADANGAYCRVMGAIRPVDPAAPAILFQANLPAQWNGKALQFGGGGYNGRIPATTGLERHGLAGTPTPLARGFLTFAGDSGHQSASADDASFALNAEALRNFGYQHIRKTLDAVRQVAIAHYGRAPRRVYFNGGSTGGREGLTAAIRWPEAYDGVITWYPTASFMGLRLWGAMLARAVYEDGSAGWIPPAMVSRIARESLARCDALDGVADGLVSNPDACRRGSAAALEALRCRGGETGNPEACLTGAQIERTMRVYHEGYRLPFAFANGATDYLGYNSLEGIAMQLGSQRELLAPPRSGPNAHHVDRAYQFFRYFVNDGRDFDIRTLDVMAPGPLRERIREISALFDATATDFSAFAARGGRIIWLQGHDDPSVSPLENRRNYAAVVARMGQAATDRFMRYYELAGLAHGGGRFSPTWESLAALDAWVEQGTPPDGAAVTDGTRGETRGRTRPLCAYPTWPRYRGGDPNNAASFACATE